MAHKAKAATFKAVDNATQRTEETEESSVYDALLSTCCCAGSSTDPNSLKERRKDNQPQHRQHDFDRPPKLWERLSDVALLLVGGAPPVKFVKCFECNSVDGSELTVPRVLTDMAEEYDRGSLSNLSSMWGSISEEEELVDVDARIPGVRSAGSSRWDKLRLKSSSSTLSRQASASKASKGSRQGLGRIRKSWSRNETSRRQDHRRSRSHRSQGSVRSALVEV